MSKFEYHRTVATLRTPRTEDIRITEVLEALAHPVRLMVVHRLAARHRTGEEIATNLPLSSDAA